MNLKNQARAGARRRVRLTTVGVAAGATGLALLLGPAALADPGPVTPVGCSADALVAAVSGATSGAILSLAPRCTYVLSTRLNLPVSMTIKGNGATITAGAPGFTLLSVNPGGPFSLDDLTVSNGNIDFGQPGDVGGAIVNFGTLTISGGTFTGNSATFGGGAIENEGTLTITGSTFTNNTSSSADGGAIDNVGALSITGSTFTSNSSVAIANEGTLTVTGSTFTGNSGSIDNGDPRASMTVTGSTFSGDSGTAITAEYSQGALRGDRFTDNTFGAVANDCADGVAADCGTLTITGSTFSGNTGLDGGAIANFSTVTVTDSVIAGNSAIFRDQLGGGLYNGAGDTATLTNTVVTGNTAGVDGGGLYNDTGGTVTLTRTSVTSNTPDNCAPAGTIAGCTG